MSLLVVLTCLGAASLFIWVGILLHPSRPWDLRPVAEDEAPPPEPAAWPAVVALVPARNEAQSLPRTLPSLLRQDYPGPFHVRLIDDRSSDGTAEAARRSARAEGLEERLSVLSGQPLPDGWVGKVWALEQGASHLGFSILDFGLAQNRSSGSPVSDSGARTGGENVVSNPKSAIQNPKFFWLTDADILHAPGALRRLVAESQAGGLALNSRMARLRCVSPAEKLLIPPFVLFFNLLYPMRRVNDPRDPLAAAAGGCMLLATEAWAGSGGFAGIRGEVIDDVNLARRVKGLGRSIRLSLSRREVESLRTYDTLADLWPTVRRTAFTELRHSWLRLACALAALALAFGAPVFLALVGAGLSLCAGTGVLELPCAWTLALAGVGLASWALLARLYAPAADFYGLSPGWRWTLPWAGALYGGMTLDSAWRHLRGKSPGWRDGGQEML